MTEIENAFKFILFQQFVRGDWIQSETPTQERMQSWCRKLGIKTWKEHKFEARRLKVFVKCFNCMTIRK